jgi:hypothetical protein
MITRSIVCSMETKTSPSSEDRAVSSSDAVSSIGDKEADLALQEQIIRDITSDDLQVLRKLGMKTVLKPHQKVFQSSCLLEVHIHSFDFRMVLLLHSSALFISTPALQFSTRWGSAKP